MSQTDAVQRIQRMKEELQAHYARFKALREAGRHSEAMAQFNVTLKAAGELMETSSAVLKDLATRAAAPEPKPQGGGKFLHVPGSDRTH
jgi:endonuclease V-like protein UPF0215 family